MDGKCCGERLIAAGTAVAFQIAQTQKPENLALPGALFNVTGDQLSLLSISKGMLENPPS